MKRWERVAHWKRPAARLFTLIEFRKIRESLDHRSEMSRRTTNARIVIEAFTLNASTSTPSGAGFKGRRRPGCRCRGDPRLGSGTALRCGAWERDWSVGTTTCSRQRVIVALLSVIGPPAVDPRILQNKILLLGSVRVSTGRGMLGRPLNTIEV